MKTKMSAKSEILSQPELLRVTPVGVKLSAITILSAFIAIYLYSWLFYAAIQAIPRSSTHYHALLATVLIVGAGIAVSTVYALVTKKKQQLIFTSIGMIGIGNYAIKYSELDCYDWQQCTKFMSTGQLSDRLQATIRLHPKSKSWLKPTYIDRFGNSIFGNFGYFFDDIQMKSANEILTRSGVRLITDTKP
jgi:hypothetical protein